MLLASAPTPGLFHDADAATSMMISTSVMLSGLILWLCIMMPVWFTFQHTRGRMFYKCAIEPKCRSFYWEDTMSKAPTNADGGSGSTASQINARSTSVFNGGGGNVLGSGPARGAGLPAGRSFTPSSQMGPPPASNASSSATEYTQSPVSPSKRARIEVSDGDHENTIESSHGVPTGWSGAKSRTSIKKFSQQQQQQYPPKANLTQTADEAIEEDWDDEIDDFEEFEAGADSPSKGKSKFTSFAGPSTPKTPPGKLAPGLPVTPMSMNTKAAQPAGPSGSGTSGARWNQIMSDPSSPFHARAVALANGGGGQTSPATGSTASLLPSSSTESAAAAPRTPPPNGNMAAPSIPQTPAEHLGSLSALAEHFSATLRGELESASKSLRKSENQLKAAQQKAKHHEKREKDAHAEIERLKEKVRLLEAENTQLKAMYGE